MDVAEARSLVLALPGVSEHDHFGRPAYRMLNAKGKPSTIFMTLWLDDHRAVLMLNVEQQADLVTHQPKGFEPHPSKWGAKGATIAHLKQLNEVLFRQALELAVGNASR